MKNSLLRIFISAIILAFVTTIIILNYDASIPEKWVNSNDFEFNIELLEPGDIIVIEKDKFNPMLWFGHSAVVMEGGYVGEYPGFGGNFNKENTFDWLELNRQGKQISVLRFSNMNNDFKKILMRNIDYYSNKDYAIWLKTSEDGFYCSQFIWFIYYKTALEMGYSLNIDLDGGIFVTPYDLLSNKYFDKIEI